MKNLKQPLPRKEKKKLSKGDIITLIILAIGSLFYAIWKVSQSPVASGLFIICEAAAIICMVITAIKKCKNELYGNKK